MSPELHDLAAVHPAPLRCRGPREDAGFAGCGVDLRDVVAGIPADGEIHEYPCPACGVSHTARRVPAE